MGITVRRFSTLQPDKQAMIGYCFLWGLVIGMHFNFHFFHIKPNYPTLDNTSRKERGPLPHLRKYSGSTYLRKYSASNTNDMGIRRRLGA